MALGGRHTRPEASGGDTRKGLRRMRRARPERAAVTAVVAGSAHQAPHVREALELAGYAVLAEPHDAATAIAVTVRTRPALCVVAADLPGGGLRATREICSRLPDVGVVVLTSSPSDAELTAVLRAGAVAYLLEASGPRRLAEALDAALEGYAVTPWSLVRRAVTAHDAPTVRRTLTLPGGRVLDLTFREAQVLDGLIDGASTRDIGQALHLSPVTVRRHLSDMMRKAAVADREALLEAVLASGDAPAPLVVVPEPEATGEDEPVHLTRRELEVLRLVAAGIRNQDIAGELVIAPSTVTNHLTRAMAKLGARNRTEAAVMAVRRGIL